MLNGFANWLAATGTIAAVIVSLKLARRASEQKARVSVGHRIMLTPGQNGPIPEFVIFCITNLGERPMRITHIGWKLRASLFKRKQAVQMYDAAISSPLPVELAHGQEASWLVPFNDREQPWDNYFAKGMMMPHYRIAARTLRASFHTSLGSEFLAAPEASLLEKLLTSCKDLAKQP